MQSRKEISTMNAKFLRFIAWLIIYSGLIIAFYLFYGATHLLIPSIVLVASIVVGSLIISMLNKQKSEVSS
jgi:predicted neutral ceramidase superfamily lipid hydrolase